MPADWEQLEQRWYVGALGQPRSSHASGHTLIESRASHRGTHTCRPACGGTHSPKTTPTKRKMTLVHKLWMSTRRPCCGHIFPRLLVCERGRLVCHVTGLCRIFASGHAPLSDPSRPAYCRCG